MREVTYDAIMSGASKISAYIPSRLDTCRASSWHSSEVINNGNNCGSMKLLEYI